MATTPVRLSIDDLPAHLAILKAELREGHTVELVSGDEIVGEVRAPEGNSVREAVRPGAPDFMARMKARWGDRCFEDSTQWIREDRDAQF